MGLTIHYNGKFNEKASLAGMIEEVKDIAEIYNWQYTIYESQFPERSSDNDSFPKGMDSHNENIYGIIFLPPECEPVFLTFLSNGRMSGTDHLIFFGSPGKEYNAHEGDKYK